MRPEVVLLAGVGDAGRLVAARLEARFGNVAVMLEPRPSRYKLIRGRIRKLGRVVVADQLAFQLIVAPALRKRARRRSNELRRRMGMEEAEYPVRTVSVPSVNHVQVRECLQEWQPKVIAVYGTRIIGKKLLKALSAPFINLHAGITPRYRGVHGAYWALAERRPDLAGATVHLIDEGIDTGAVLEQVPVEPGDYDSFVTYPLLQLEAGLPAYLDAIERAREGKLEPIAPMSERGPLRYHPRASEYLYNRWRHGVR